MTRVVFLLGLATVLAGCNAVPQGLFGQSQNPEPIVTVTPSLEDGEVPQDATTVEEFDTTSEDDRAAALQGAASTGGEEDLGTTIASLGDVTQAGFWLKTPLVTEPAKGRVEFTENGKAVAVDLIPLAGEPGAGSRISLAAMRLLEVDLTALAELNVFKVN
ncbi:MAG: hypothetical protein AAFO72_08430 [Pseudomonadota bacterium]